LTAIGKTVMAVDEVMQRGPDREKEMVQERGIEIEELLLAESIERVLFQGYRHAIESKR